MNAKTQTRQQGLCTVQSPVTSSSPRATASTQPKAAPHSPTCLGCFFLSPLPPPLPLRAVAAAALLSCSAATAAWKESSLNTPRSSTTMNRPLAPGVDSQQHRGEERGGRVCVCVRHNRQAGYRSAEHPTTCMCKGSLVFADRQAAVLPSPAAGQLSWLTWAVLVTAAAQRQQHHPCRRPCPAHSPAGSM
jgi:hypothetical protein